MFIVGVVRLFELILFLGSRIECILVLGILFIVDEII